MSFVCQTTPTTAGTVNLIKNGVNVYTMPNIGSGSNSITFNNINITYTAGDTFNIMTLIGGGGTLIRGTVSCQVGGVVGRAGTITVGTISSLSSTSTPTVINVGTTNDAIFNFGIPKGQSPTITVGTVSTLSSGSNATVSNVGTSLNPIFNFSIPQAIQGQKGDTGDAGQNGQNGQKGDKGDTGDAGDFGAIATGLGNLTATGLVGLASTLGITTLQEEVATIQGQISGIDTDLTTLNGKTALQTCDGVLLGEGNTNFNGKVNIGSGLNPNRIILDGSPTGGGKITASNLTILNSTGTSSITILSNDGSITGNSLTVSTGHIDALTTNLNQAQNIYSNSSVTIGNISAGTGIASVNLNGIVYINGVPLIPWSSASSFFSQW
jgi:hypothetical protein